MTTDQSHGQQIAKLIALAVAEEREACAAFLEEQAGKWLEHGRGLVTRRAVAVDLERIAAAIRARGKERHEQ
jgi:hypothetical protein